MKTALALAAFLLVGCARLSDAPVKSGADSRRQLDVACEEKAVDDGSVRATAVTAILGILGFIASQLALKLMLEPAAQVRKVLGDISAVLLANQHRIQNPKSDPELAKKLKELAGQLVGSVWAVAAYDKVRVVRLWNLPTKEAAAQAAQGLNLIASNMSGSVDRVREAYEQLTEVGDILGIPVEYEGYRSLCPPAASKRRT